MNWLNNFSIAILTVIGCNTLSANAQADYPNKPINFIVPYGAGGGADSRSRQIGLELAKILKVPVII